MACQVIPHAMLHQVMPHAMLHHAMSYHTKLSLHLRCLYDSCLTLCLHRPQTQRAPGGNCSLGASDLMNPSSSPQIGGVLSHHSFWSNTRCRYTSPQPHARPLDRLGHLQGLLFVVAVLQPLGNLHRGRVVEAAGEILVWGIRGHLAGLHQGVGPA